LADFFADPGAGAASAAVGEEAAFTFKLIFSRAKRCPGTYCRIDKREIKERSCILSISQVFIIHSSEEARWLRHQLL
jgi:hypothetical protein